MGRKFAGVLGLLAFLVMVVRSLLHGSSTGASLPMACLCLFVFAAVGWLLGTLAQQTVDQSVRFIFDRQLQNARNQGEPASSQVNAT